MIDENTFKNLKLPRYEKVRWEIQKLLIQSKWDVKVPIPSEQELSQMYSVSIGTVRKAIEGLVNEGLLIKCPGKGTFLKQPNFESSLMRFFRLRNKRGDYIQQLVGEVKKLEVIDAIPEINARLNLENTTKLVYLERVRKDGDKIVLSEKIWLSEDLFSNLKDIPLKSFGNFLYPFYYQHCDQFISSAVEQLSFECNISDKYLQNDISEPLAKVCRTAKNLEGIVIEYRQSYGLAQNFQYEISIF